MCQGIIATFLFFSFAFVLFISSFEQNWSFPLQAKNSKNSFSMSFKRKVTILCFYGDPYNVSIFFYNTVCFRCFKYIHAEHWTIATHLLSSKKFHFDVIRYGSIRGKRRWVVGKRAVDVHCIVKNEKVGQNFVWKTAFN